jgi:hypothetical protein
LGDGFRHHGGQIGERRGGGELEVGEVVLLEPGAEAGPVDGYEGGDG